MAQVAIYIVDGTDENPNDGTIAVEVHSSDNGADTESNANIVGKYIADNWDALVKIAVSRHRGPKAGPTDSGAAAPAILKPADLHLYQVAPAQAGIALH